MIVVPFQFTEQFQQSSPENLTKLEVSPIAGFLGSAVRAKTERL